MAQQAGGSLIKVNIDPASIEGAYRRIPQAMEKDGTHVESLCMQSRENLKRVAVIQAFIAIRLFQLKDVVQGYEEAKETPCTRYFSEISWKLLGAKHTKKSHYPQRLPL